MKGRISFAEVLKKKAKSSRIDVTPQQYLNKLSDIIA
jgi:hypothetical protein